MCPGAFKSSWRYEQGRGGLDCGERSRRAPCSFAQLDIPLGLLESSLCMHVTCTLGVHLESAIDSLFIGPS